MRSHLSRQELRAPVPEGPVLIGIRNHADDNVFGLYAAAFFEFLDEQPVERFFHRTCAWPRRYLQKHDLVAASNAEARVLDDHARRFVFVDDLIAVARQHFEGGEYGAMGGIEQSLEFCIAAALDEIET